MEENRREAGARLSAKGVTIAGALGRICGMKTHLSAALILVVFLTACEPPSPAGEAAPSPSAAPAPTPTPAESPAPAATAGSDMPVQEAGVEAAVEVDIDPENTETRLVKEEVLKRIDLMPGLTDEEKDKLYVQVERARGMGRLMKVAFATGQKRVAHEDVAALREKLGLPQFASFSSDPTVVFVVLGFADTAGDPEKNLQLSRARAEAVATTLEQECGVLNVIRSVGMGSSEIFGAADLDKNRVAEIWAVLP